MTDLRAVRVILREAQACLTRSNKDAEAIVAEGLIEDALNRLDGRVELSPRYGRHELTCNMVWALRWIAACNARDYAARDAIPGEGQRLRSLFALESRGLSTWDAARYHLLTDAGRAALEEEEVMACP